MTFFSFKILFLQNMFSVFDIIIDIGCGTGNVTLMLNKQVPHKRIVAFDISPVMVDYAKKNYPDPSIEYMVQDISVQWDKLHPQIKELEGKVSLVFSNRVLHWVIDKQTMANNIARLLKPGGKFYASITW